MAARAACLEGEAAATLLRLCSASSSESSSKSESSAMFSRPVPRLLTPEVLFDWGSDWEGRDRDLSASER